jgi:hypothetical protein
MHNLFLGSPTYEDDTRPVGWRKYRMTRRRLRKIEADGGITFVTWTWDSAPPGPRYENVRQALIHGGPMDNTIVQLGDLGLGRRLVHTLVRFENHRRGLWHEELIYDWGMVDPRDPTLIHAWWTGERRRVS